MNSLHKARILLCTGLALISLCWANLCIVPSALAQAAQAKVGFVATQAVRERFQDYQNARQRLDAITSDWKRDLDDQQASIQALEIEIQKKRLIWSDAERRDKDSVLAKKKRDREEYIRKKFNAGGEFDTLATNILRPVEAKIVAAVQDVAANEGYDIVLDKATQPILVGSPRFDLTVKVMEKLGIFADDLKAKQQEVIDREEKQRQEQRKIDTSKPVRAKRPTRNIDNTEEKK
jgi:outer membrane protein